MYNYIESMRGDGMATLLIVIFIIMLMTIIICIKIVPSNQVYIIERVGRYFCTWNAGIHVKMPFIDRIKVKYIVSTFDVEIPCDNIQTNDNRMINLKVYAKLNIINYYQYTYTQASKQFENLIYNELSNICKEYLFYQIGASSKEIESKLEYPGHIKVNVIRESRFSDTAK